MKKTLLACALASSAVSSFAQSSNTLYGIIDTGVAYINNQAGHSNLFMESGWDSANRFGFKGTETLGGGYAAIYQLEAGFNSTTGTASGGLMFGRWAYVGISSPYGTLKLGRQYDFMSPYLFADSNMEYQSLWAGQYNDADRIAGEWVNNAVSWESAAFAGLRVGLMYGFSNAVGAFNGTSGSPRTVSAGARYHRGRLGIDFAFTKSNGTGASISQNLFGASDSRAMGLGARYAFDRFTVYGNINASYYNGIKGGLHQSIQGTDFGVRAALTPTFLLTPGVSLTRVEGKGSGQFNLTGDYLLSRRTDIQTGVFYAHAFNDRFQPALLPALNLATDVGASTSVNQVGVRVALRTRF
ncbi:porin [Paraburkholderia acidisoli]|uniref:Porin n=1 Tax=Paraburkholderia acidisoli TaxID=2571748 RepID=A0A7Z2JGZ4_9BURK|nr:porin [Paraburkholderia acidisoli]QGZ64266.1 porin [Paraburkholderia acidisoli]